MDCSQTASWIKNILTWWRKSSNSRIIAKGTASSHLHPRSSKTPPKSISKRSWKNKQMNYNDWNRKRKGHYVMWGTCLKTSACAICNFKQTNVRQNTIMTNNSHRWGSKCLNSSDILAPIYFPSNKIRMEVKTSDKNSKNKTLKTDSLKFLTNFMRNCNQ